MQKRFWWLILPAVLLVGCQSLARGPAPAAAAEPAAETTPATEAAAAAQSGPARTSRPAREIVPVAGELTEEKFLEIFEAAVRVSMEVYAAHGIHTAEDLLRNEDAAARGHWEAAVAVDDLLVRYGIDRKSFNRYGSAHLDLLYAWPAAHEAEWPRMELSFTRLIDGLL